MEPLTFGSLFAGIGGFDLGFERAGMTCKWQVEIDDYANRVLAKHWPDVRRHGDIRTFPPGPADDWRVDVICGGFPCQDISYAGAGAGLAGERSGLFYEAMRVVRVLEPRCVVLENVAALLTRGLPEVLGTLAAFGFDAEWHCLPAAAFGAPHIRDRVFIYAHRDGKPVVPVNGEAPWMPQGHAADAKHNGRNGASLGRSVAESEAEGRLQESQRCVQCRRFFSRYRCNSPDECDCPPCQGLCECATDVRHAKRPPENIHATKADATKRRQIPASQPSLWGVEPAVGRVADGIPARVDRLRGLGNAVVPQVAQWIGQRIVEAM